METDRNEWFEVLEVIQKLLDLKIAILVRLREGKNGEEWVGKNENLARQLARK